MAFHFNWSPLIADTDRVRHMLTSSLNKSPKPPIIVDDIIVNELNLGSNPPSLEILEIGDLAEDRFRGIFKVKYEGDAYLTLRTKVQANPLNTFLSSKPSFASPTPLAAGSGLTIPLQITLSDIRLSGFVILVFSKQKGITLVFRNDPLESLKVSSTFDSIPFVRDYLQRTIEGQLRVLFMEDLPAIIHRLSLRVWNEEYQNMSPEKLEAVDAEGKNDEKGAVDPLASPAQGAIDVDDQTWGLPFSLDPSGETYASFSQKNLVRLAALAESQRTLSLFTPNIRDAVYRAWASVHDRSPDGAMSPLHHKPLATLSRIQSIANVQHAHTASMGTRSTAASQSSEAPSHATRPSLASIASMQTSTSYTLGSGRPRTHGARKKKHRVVNLRRNKDDTSADSTSEADTATLKSSYDDDSASRSESVSASGSAAQSGREVSTVPTSTMLDSGVMLGQPVEREGEVTTPMASPERKKRVEFNQQQAHLDEQHATAGAEKATLRRRPVTPRHQHLIAEEDEATPRQSMYLPTGEPPPPPKQDKHPRRQAINHPPLPPTSAPPGLPRTSSDLSISDLLPSYPFAEGGASSSSGGILEQAWMTKMAREIARRVEEERERADRERSASSSEKARLESVRLAADEAPPAYQS
jgi:mitochondrial distribution and morphology protein 34